MAKLLILIGVVLILAGIVIHFHGRIPFLGRLPGDIRIERENFRFYFPITTSILISLLITLMLYLFNRFKG